jgi:hypothetical protein
MRLRYVGMEPAKESMKEELTKEPRVDLPMIEQCCFWCPNKTWTPPLGTSDTLTIVKNGLNEKVMAPQSTGGQELKKQITEHYKGQFSNT